MGVASQDTSHDASEVPVLAEIGARHLRFLAWCALAGALLGVLSGWLWVLLAAPPQVPKASDGELHPTLLQTDAIATVPLWFFVVGIVLGLIAGLVVGWTGIRYGWWTVGCVLVLCGLATVGGSLLGQHVFGANQDAGLAQAEVGELVQTGVGLRSVTTYLGWPIGGLVGVLVSVLVRGSHKTGRE